MSDRNSSKFNSPTFIYSVLYGKRPDPPLVPRDSSVNHKQYTIDGVAVDKNVPKEAMLKLWDIKEIETRSSCEGSSSIRPTFLVIRTKNRNKVYIQKFCDKLNKYKDIKCGFDIGNSGEYRIGITTPLWYEKDKIKFIRWWMSLAEKIKLSL